MPTLYTHTQPYLHMESFGSYTMTRWATWWLCLISNQEHFILWQSVGQPLRESTKKFLFRILVVPHRPSQLTDVQDRLSTCLYFSMSWVLGIFRSSPDFLCNSIIIQQPKGAPACAMGSACGAAVNHDRNLHHAARNDEVLAAKARS